MNVMCFQGADKSYFFSTGCRQAGQWACGPIGQLFDGQSVGRHNVGRYRDVCTCRSISQLVGWYNACAIVCITCTLTMSDKVGGQ